MGGSAPKKIIKKVLKPAKKVLRGAGKAAGEVFEELIEKPGKKIARETVDTLTGMDKYDRRPPEATEPEVTPEVTPEVVPDDTMLGRGTRRTKGKRAGGAGTLMEGYGATYSKPSAKSPTGGA